MLGSNTNLNRLFGRLIITSGVAIIIFWFVWYITENWYHRFNVLRPLNDIVKIKLTSLPGAFTITSMLLTILVLIATQLSRTDRLPKHWWYIHIAMLIINTVGEIWQWLYPPYPDNQLIDIIAGAVGIGISYLLIRYVLAKNTLPE